MKNSILLLFLFLGTYGLAKSQAGMPDAASRGQMQQARINQGVRSGSLSKGEARLLRAQQRQIRRSAKIARMDGKVTIHEQRRLAKQQKHADRSIRRAKHNGIDR
jgi:hypothetical protein